MSEIDQIRALEDRHFQRQVLRWSAIVLAGGVAAVVAWFFGIEALNAALGLDMEPFEFGRIGSLWAWIVSFVLVVVAAFGIHELVHGFFLKQFAPPGARVTYGIDWKAGMAYACAEGVMYTRRHYRTIILAPTVVVTGALVAIGIGFKWPFWTIAAATAHLSGCTGDWVYLWRMHRDPRITHCEDTSWGVRFFGEDNGDYGDPGADNAGRTDVERMGFIVVDGGAALGGVDGGAPGDPAAGE